MLHGRAVTEFGSVPYGDASAPTGNLQFAIVRTSDAGGISTISIVMTETISGEKIEAIISDSKTRDEILNRILGKCLVGTKLSEIRYLIINHISGRPVAYRFPLRVDYSRIIEHRKASPKNRSLSPFTQGGCVYKWRSSDVVADHYRVFTRSFDKLPVSAWECNVLLHLVNPRGEPKPEASHGSISVNLAAWGN